MMVYRKSKIFLFLFFLVVLGEALHANAEAAPYYSITGPCNLSFPQDHGPHPGYRTEWWYYTGNLRSETGDRYGFQLTFFRRQISPPGADEGWPKPTSAWRTQQLFLAHAALTDIGKKRFHHGEAMSREVPGLAGANQEAGRTSIFVKNWSVRLDGNEHLLEAQAEGFAFSLKLRPLKAPVLHGESGYSRKGTAPESASCYYSITRLQAEGSVSLNGTSLPVHGTAWMDHEFSSAPLESNLAGWDWFSLQFANNTELMLYLLRTKDGKPSDASGGTFVDASGKITHLDHNAISLELLDRWKSPHTGTTYPSGWRLKIKPLQADLKVVPNLQDQEMQTPGTTNVTYWEGSVSAHGTFGGQDVSGEGYGELTGYATAMDGRS
jgi:predicted secreted hydrolase